MNDQIKAWIAKHAAEVEQSAVLLEAKGYPRHANDLRESWDPVAAAMDATAPRPVLTRAQAVTIACALCADGDIHEQADAVLRIAGDGAPVLTEEAARKMASGVAEEVKRAIPTWAQFEDTDGGLVAAVEAVIEAEVSALLLRVAGPVTEGEASMDAAFKAAAHVSPDEIRRACSRLGVREDAFFAALMPASADYRPMVPPNEIGEMATTDGEE